MREGARGRFLCQRYPRREGDACPASRSTPGEEDKERNGFCFAHFWNETSRSTASRLALAKRSRSALILCSVPPPEASVSRHAAGAGCGSQAPRTQSHRLTHQPHVPLAATHRAPNPAMPRRPHNRLSRQLSRLPTGLSKSHPRQRDFLIVAPFGKRFDYIDSINVI